MKVRMKVQISGSRDGQPWPDRGGVIDLPEAEAKNLITADMASAVQEKKADAPAPEEKRPAPDAGVEKRAQPRQSQAKA